MLEVIKSNCYYKTGTVITLALNNYLGLSVLIKQLYLKMYIILCHNNFVNDERAHTYIFRGYKFALLQREQSESIIFKYNFVIVARQ